VVAFATFGLELPSSSGKGLRCRQLVSAGEVSDAIRGDSREMVLGYLGNIQSICYPQGFQIETISLTEFLHQNMQEEATTATGSFIKASINTPQ
jgi:hypothetical protein